MKELVFYVEKKIGCEEDQMLGQVLVILEFWGKYLFIKSKLVVVSVF